MCPRRRGLDFSADLSYAVDLTPSRFLVTKRKREEFSRASLLYRSTRALNLTLISTEDLLSHALDVLKPPAHRQCDISSVELEDVSRIDVKAFLGCTPCSSSLSLNAMPIALMPLHPSPAIT
ncbi:hypothetical protein KOW79_013108 [Hemibagrus wyckioides]|uniref:Uncharacterized protein n=1 Tax=Hemibagrus wyckioides TaxID=337641 RepID=A0A9D3SGG0_9TELE|nr:hypothetical protein KOW79_013108 [Hemibagrus wyckioides]